MDHTGSTAYCRFLVPGGVHPGATSVRDNTYIGDHLPIGYGEGCFAVDKLAANFIE